MTIFIRIGLAILFLVEFVVGAWNTISPETFYLYFPTVDHTPPFSEHYARDFGGATLGIALLLGIALVAPKAHFIIPATRAYSMFSVPHFFYHAAHLDDAHGVDAHSMDAPSAGTHGAEALALSAVNATVALLGIAIILATIARDYRRKPPAQERDSSTHVAQAQDSPLS
jgi:hypothetical protein